MKILLSAGAALGLALTAAPALADNHMDGMTMTAAQKTMYDGWTAEQRSTYDAWPMNAKTYYWTLDDMQRDVWWNTLNNEQRVRIVGMTPQQRTAAWTSISNQMNAGSNAMASNATTQARTTSPRMNGEIQFRRSERVQMMPSGYQQAGAGELPVCTPNQQSGCINSWERNRTGTRPLNYWPGRSASKMD